VPTAFGADREEFLEDLCDLKHDLGKYILLPVALLPKDAEPDELLDAVRTALDRTRMSGNQTLSAAVIWDRFVEKWKGKQLPAEAFQNLRFAIERALELKEQLHSGRTPIDRDNIQQILGSVRAKIEEMIAEVENERD